METCGTCKHWKREPEWDLDSSSMVLPLFGQCSRIPQNLDTPWHYAAEADEKELQRDTLAYISYDVADLETQESFGCVLHEPLP